MALNLAMSYCEMAMSSGDMSQYEKGMKSTRPLPPRRTPNMPKMLPRPRRIWRSMLNIIWLPRCRLPTISTGSSRWPTTWAKNPQSALAQNVRLQAYANKKDYKVIELGQAAADAQTDPADKS